MELPLHLFRRAIPVILDPVLPVLSQNVLRNIDLNKMRHIFLRMHFVSMYYRENIFVFKVQKFS